MHPFLARLRERKLFQWAAAYLAGAWLVLQVLDLLAESFHWSGEVERSATVILGVGLAGALVLAWYHGEKGAQRASGIELAMLCGILVLAGVGVAWVRTGAGAATPPPGGRGVEAPVLPPAAGLRGIAVLPFANLSSSRDNEYFSDGITDEILTLLANVGDLRVISRTSVMQYKGTAKPVRTIAAELGVAHVLEGSIQRSGNRVRIMAQLIDARTDTHLWARRFDRPIEDLFAVQSEIAQEIARALQAELSPDEQARLSRRPTADATAHDYLLRGRELVRRRNPRDNANGLALLRRARALGPRYADAHIALSEAFLEQYIFQGDRAWLDSIAASARRAVELDPELAAGHAWLGWAADFRGNWDAALAAHRRAVALDPRHSDGLANLYHYGFGRLDEAARWWRPALERDPTNGLHAWLAGRSYLNLGMTARARLHFETAVEFQPEYALPRFHAAVALLREGKRAEAGAWIGRMLSAADSSEEAMILAGQFALLTGDLATARRHFERALPGGESLLHAWGTIGLAWVLQRTGEARRSEAATREATRLLERLWGGGPRRPEDFADLARVRLLRGDRTGALRAFEEGVERGWRFHGDGLNEPVLDGLRGDPTFDALMTRVRADVDRQRERVEREGW